MDGFVVWLNILIIGFLAAIGLTMYIIFDKTGCFPKPIKTQEKPTISWELKSNGQTVDTIWIYKFK